MKILAVNWLDLENPQAGGAEIHFFEIFQRLAAGGDQVTLVTSGFRGAAPRVMMDGIDVRRYGGRYTFAARGRGIVRQHLRHAEYDIVVEDINKLPLYLSNLTDLPTYVIIPHLFGATAFREAAWPIAAVVWLAERPVPWVYRRAAFHAISESTRDDLMARGVSAERVRVIYPGVDSTRFSPDPGTCRAAGPTFLYVGRLKRYKGVDVAIRALASLRERHEEATLQIAGEGDDRPRLERLAASLGVAQAVQFLGFVSEEVKLRLLRRAWALVFPSLKEGWGLANVEAAACGTPAIAANSPGLRESVIDGQTGMLVEPGDVGGFAEAMATLAGDGLRLERLGAAAREFATRLSWERTAEQTRAHLRETLTMSTTGGYP